MKITDRIDTLSGVEKSYWDHSHNRLVVYYDETVPLGDVHIRVSGAIAGIQLQSSIDEMTYISTRRESAK